MMMETQTSNLCSGCLAVDRRMLQIQHQKEQCFLQIIKELPISLSNSIALWLCWECEANITRFTKFKLQVKRSYQILHDFTVQNTIPPHSKFSIQQLVNITLSPDSDNEPDSVTVTTVTVKTERDNETPQIKHETDSDDELLIDICNDNAVEPLKTEYCSKKNGKLKKNGAVRKNGKPKRNGEERTNGKLKINGEEKKNGKLKRNNCKLKVKKSYKEIELTEKEIEEERNDIALREDFVNAMFRCEKCLLSFPNEDDMKDHVFKKHELHASKNKCSICECSFNTEVAFNYHRSRHSKRYECLICSAKCTSQLAVKNHCVTVHFQSSAYDLEHKIYKKYGLKDLNGTKSEDKFPCEYCPKVFGWKTSLRKHLETHKIEAGQKRRPYCEPCRLSFTTTANLQKHVKTSSKHQIQLKLRKLKESNSEVSNDKQIADIRTSVNSKRELFPCAQCDKKFQWRGNLLRHLDSHAARAAGELVCTPCNRTFSSIATFQQHMKISKKHASENDYKYMCSDCGKKFANKTKLKDHVDWDHLKNYVHICTDCQKVFKTHTSLYLHRQVVHKKANAEHLCENCGKSFPNQTKLRSHIIALHTSESPYKCAECGARFSWHSCLSRHLRRVHRTNK